MPMPVAVWGLALASWVAAPVQVLHVPDDDGAVAIARPKVVAGSKQARIRALVGDAVAASLPQGWRVDAVQLVGEPLAFAGRAPHGTLIGAARIEAQFAGPLRSGKQAISIVVVDDRGPVERRQARVDLQRTVSADGVKRGTEVTVRVRSGNVYVQARCVAQSTAAVGEHVVVLCDNATRTLGASVVSSKEVEVTL